MSTRAEKKLSAKTIMGNIIAIKNGMIKEGVKHRDLYTMIGSASAFEQGISSTGEWTALTGEFEAVNLDDGEISTAFKAFLPRDITHYFVSALKQANGSVVEFAVKVGIKLTDTTIGYEYTCSPIVPLKQSNSLNRLREEAKKMLPAPKPEKKGKE